MAILFVYPPLFPNGRQLSGSFSVVQRIWVLIVEVINVIAEFIACNTVELIENLINI